MGIAITLKEYLDNEGVEYETLTHMHTTGSLGTAEEAHIPGAQLAKGVILEDDTGYLMVVVPAVRRVQLGQLHKQLNRQLGLATEQELAELFFDCEPGAVPPLGSAYGMEQIVDDSLADCEDIYFEAGNHVDVVHVSGRDFRRMMAGTPFRQFTRHI